MFLYNRGVSVYSFNRLVLFSSFNRGVSVSQVRTNERWNYLDGHYTRYFLKELACLRKFNITSNTDKLLLEFIY